MDKNERSKELVANMRLYSDMRFKQLTIFMTWLTLSVGGVAQFGDKSIANGLNVNVLIACASLIFISILWIMEIKSTIYWAANREEVRCLWPSLNIQYPRYLKFLSFFDATNAILVLYTCTLFFWVFCLFNWLDYWWLSFAGIGILIFLIIFTVFNYKPLWAHKK